MADEAEEECMSMLSLLSFPVHSPDHEDKSGCSTPPFHISASVPFNWEEEPGKPIPSTALIHFTQPISLQLTPPPRMALVDPIPKVTIKTKTSSPTSAGSAGSNGPFPERGLLGPMVMSGVNKMGKKKLGSRRLFGSWSWRRKSKRSGDMSKCKKDGFGGSFVFPSSVSASFDGGRECCSEYGGESECAGEQVNLSKMKKSKSFLSLTRVMPWKGIKLKIDGVSTRVGHRLATG